MLLQQLGQSLVVHAPAKLNLFLEILSKRPDGFHELETLMVSVGLYDTLIFAEEDSNRVCLRVFDAGLQVPGDKSLAGDVPDDRTNLVVRAAELLKEHAGVGYGIRIELHKRIPVAAGLAGGSSDAAATLVALNRFWNLRLTFDELKMLASQLGSDVAFFLSGTSAAICRGRGEIIEPLCLPLGLPFVIAVPSSGLSTASVFGHCQPASHPKSMKKLIGFLRQGRLPAAVELFHNGLEEVAKQLNPEVSELEKSFSRETLLGHQMSGSGSAYFGVYSNRRQALKGAARLKVRQKGRVFVAQSGP